MAVAGIVAGFVNTFAGGGSLLTLPALMLAGLPPEVANGTNRVGIVAQSISGVLGFRAKGKLPPVGGILIPTFAGAALGAWLAAAVLPQSWQRPVLLTLLVTMAVVMVVRPKAIAVAEGEAAPRRVRDSPASVAGLFVAGVYGGFVQAGVGFALLAVLGGVLRYDLVRANALKLSCTLVFGCVALAIFAWHGHVRWVPGAIVAAATVVGSLVGVRFASRVDPRTLRVALAIMVVLVCAASFLRS